MREIKFRAWDNKIRGFHYWDFNKQKYDNIFWTIVKEDKLQVNQYTCLKDKNGKEIYEGDIVKSNLKNDNLVVFFVRSCFRLAYSKELIGTGLEINFYEELEVIGNIYENPELLK